MHDINKVCPKYFLQETIITNGGNITVENEKVKYLGLYFNNDLMFKHQAAIVSCKVNRMVNGWDILENAGYHYRGQKNHIS